MAKDFLGQEIVLGDEVVFAQLYYRSLAIGTVIKITDKTFQIQVSPHTTFRQFHDQVIKKPKVQ